MAKAERKIVESPGNYTHTGAYMNGIQASIMLAKMLLSPVPLAQCLHRNEMKSLQGL